MASVSKVRTKDGRTKYRARYRDLDRHQREQWFDRKIEADAFCAAVVTDQARGSFVDPRHSEVTLRVWSETWWETKSHLKPSTIASYESLVRLLILPPLGNRSIGSIRSEDVGSWLAELKSTGLSASRIQQAYRVLNNLFSLAVDYERLVRNPASTDGIRRAVPKPTIQEMRFLSFEEVLRLSDVVGEQYSALILTLAVGGLRWSEAAALRRSRVDLRNHRIHVVEGATEVRGQLIFGTPKSGRDRWVDIPRYVSKAIAERMESIGSDPDALVFTTQSGTPLRRSNFRNRVWQRALRDAGISEDTRIHDLRHTAASLMVDDGVHMFFLQQQLGHASIVTTQRYAHLYPSQGIDLRDRMDDRFSKLRGAGVGLGELKLVSIVG